MSNSMRELSEGLLKVLGGAYKEVCDNTPDDENLRDLLEIISQTAEAGKDTTRTAIDGTAYVLFEYIESLSKSALEAFNRMSSTNYINFVSADNGVAGGICGN